MLCAATASACTNSSPEATTAVKSAPPDNAALSQRPFRDLSHIPICAVSVMQCCDRPEPLTEAQHHFLSLLQPGAQTTRCVCCGHVHGRWGSTWSYDARVAACVCVCCVGVVRRICIYACMLRWRMGTCRVWMCCDGVA